MKEDESYNDAPDAEPIKLVSDVKMSMRSELSAIADKLNDPVFLGALMYRTVSERENTNRLLKTIISKIEGLEQRIGKLESAPAEKQENETMLGEADEQVMEYVKSSGKVAAEDVRLHFGYKGKNAASARLSRLYQMGLLSKKQAGRKVFYQSKNP